MEVVWFIIGLLLTILGVIGVVRGGIDKKYITNSLVSLIPLVIGMGFIFFGAAPPLLAVGSLLEVPAPPPTFDATSRSIEEIIKRGTTVSTDFLPEQQHIFSQWEKQVIKAYKNADNTLKQVNKLMNSLNQGRLDRFTTWSRLGVLSVDLNQADLQLHDLTPPTKLDLVDQKMLQKGLDFLHKSLDKKRTAITNLKSFASVPSQEKFLDEYAKNMESGHELMVQGITEIARVKGRLDL